MSCTTVNAIFLQHTDNPFNALKAFRVIQTVIRYDFTDPLQNLQASMIQKLYSILWQRKHHLSPAKHFEHQLLQ